MAKNAKNCGSTNKKGSAYQGAKKSTSRETD